MGFDRLGRLLRRPCERGDGVLDEGAGLDRQPVVVQAGVRVHPGDGGPGEDVVELQQERLPPQALQVVVRVGE